MPCCIDKIQLEATYLYSMLVVMLYTCFIPLLKEICIKTDVRKGKTLFHTVTEFIKSPVISNIKKKYFTLENNTYLQPAKGYNYTEN